jgi:hypothetical protein
MVYIILRQLQFIMFTILLLITLQILNSFKEFLQYHVQAIQCCHWYIIIKLTLGRNSNFIEHYLEVPQN